MVKNATCRIKKVDVIDIFVFSRFTDQGGDRIFLPHMRHYSGSGSGFKGVEQHQSLAMEKGQGFALFPIQITIGGYADEDKKKADPRYDGKGREVEFLVLDKMH